MSDHRAERLQVECPICHHQFGGGLTDHLLAEHTREELAGQIVAYYEAEEQGTFA